MNAIKLSEKHICEYLPARFSVDVENETKKILWKICRWQNSLVDSFCADVLADSRRCENPDREYYLSVFQAFFLLRKYLLTGRSWYVPRANSMLAIVTDKIHTPYLTNPKTKSNETENIYYAFCRFILFLLTKSRSPKEHQEVKSQLLAHL